LPYTIYQASLLRKTLLKELPGAHEIVGVDVFFRGLREPLQRLADVLSLLAPEVASLRIAGVEQSRIVELFNAAGIATTPASFSRAFKKAIGAAAFEILKCPDPGRYSAKVWSALRDNVRSTQTSALRAQLAKARMSSPSLPPKKKSKANIERDRQKAHFALPWPKAGVAVERRPEIVPPSFVAVEDYAAEERIRKILGREWLDDRVYKEFLDIFQATPGRLCLYHEIKTSPYPVSDGPDAWRVLIPAFHPFCEVMWQSGLSVYSKNRQDYSIKKTEDGKAFLLGKLGQHFDIVVDLDNLVFMQKRKYAKTGAVFNPMLNVMKLVGRRRVPAASKVWTRPISAVDDTPLALWAARERLLPAGFDRWGICNRAGRTVAHEAAASGVLPSNFLNWGMRDRERWTVAHEAAQHGRLPESYLIDWMWHSRSRVSVAEVAVAHGRLPDCDDAQDTLSADGTPLLVRALFHGLLDRRFERWDAMLPDNSGNTIAHYAAMRHHLPQGFSQWGILNSKGETVAHVAASHECLPAGFDQWHLKDANGSTVAHVVAGMPASIFPEYFHHWNLRDEAGDTVAHVKARQGWMPDSFDQWHLKDANGSTVAHVRAKHGWLPDWFLGWEMLDAVGDTVAHIAARHGYLPFDFPQMDLVNAKGLSVEEERSTAETRA